MPHDSASIRPIDSRALGPEMRAEGWYLLTSENLDYESYLWCHPPSRRSVEIEGPVPRKGPGYDCSKIPALPTEPDDPLTEGYLVLCRESDEHGNPFQGDGFWTPSFATALRVARRVRSEILAGSQPAPFREQVAMFPEADDASK